MLTKKKVLITSADQKKSGFKKVKQLSPLWIWGNVYGVLIPGIALVAGPHRPENSAEKIFYIDFDGQKCDFFLLFRKYDQIVEAFRGPKDRFPAKYDISGHYVTKYGFLKNRILGDFFF